MEIAYMDLYGIDMTIKHVSFACGQCVHYQSITWRGIGLDSEQRYLI